MTTAKQVMRKYKIAVGICGPTIMYSKVIKAATPEEAVEKYLADSEDEYTEAEKDMLLRHTIEIGIIKPKVKTKPRIRTSMKDYDLNDVKVGDLVAFVCIRRNVSGPERHSIQKGTIVKFTDSTAVIDCEDLGKSFRIVEAKDEYRNEEKLKKVALLKEYNAEANDDTAKDALGQELKIGDSVAYMDNIYIDSCDGFIKGTVTKLTAKFVEMDGYKRKSYEKVVRIKKNN